MLHAKVDLTLAYHPKAHAAGRAMATWTWGLLYSREQELDGFVPATALRLSWVGEAQAAKDMASLVASGLALVVDGGWRLANYEAKNETKAQIDARRRADRDRKRKADGFQTASKPSSARTPSGFPPQGIPDSGSDSGSGSGSPEGVQGEGPPDWWDGVLATIAGTVEPIAEPGAAWLKYRGHRATKRMPMNVRDAEYWLTTVIVPDQRKAREKHREAEDRKARFAKAPGLVEHEATQRKLSPEREREFQRELQAILGGKGTGT